MGGSNSKQKEEMEEQNLRDENHDALEELEKKQNIEKSKGSWDRQAEKEKKKAQQEKEYAQKMKGMPMGDINSPDLAVVGEGDGAVAGDGADGSTEQVGGRKRRRRKKKSKKKKNKKSKKRRKRKRRRTKKKRRRRRRRRTRK